jgi:hypothetical protein
MVEFVTVDSLLKPCVEVFGSVGFQVDLIEKGGVERPFELLAELDVRRVIFLGVFLNDKTGFLSAYLEFVDELVCLGVPLM